MLRRREHQPLNLNEFSILRVLANHCAEHGDFASPTLETLILQCAQTPHELAQSLDKLKKHGYIVFPGMRGIFLLAAFRNAADQFGRKSIVGEVAEDYLTEFLGKMKGSNRVRPFILKGEVELTVFGREIANRQSTLVLEPYGFAYRRRAP